MIGRIIGNYKIESKLGEGGMGAVYKGVDTMLDREVAIKALRPELTNQTAVVERFRSEAVTLAKLHHPNIATLYSLFRHDDELYMVLEYVRGETLDEILSRRGALPADEVIPVFSQILDGIDHAHKFGIIHRDIKPANMMLTEDGKLKVLDFGIARLLGTDRMTRAGNIIGTLEYMSPEQVKGQETDARSDIYALGMMLYEILTGHLPFETENEFELMKMQIEALPPTPRLIKAEIPQLVEEAIMRAIQKNPADRFQTAGDFRGILLDAGYAAHGEMRHITGSHQQGANTSQEAMPISRPDASEQTTITDQNIIKETRLGAQSVSQPHEIKETRFGGNITADEAAAAGSFTAMYDAISSGSFFEKLTWVHYAGAGGAVFGFAALLFIVTIFAFGGGEPAKIVIESKPSPAPSVEVKAQTVEEEIKPPAPTPAAVSQPVAVENPRPVDVEPVDSDPEMNSNSESNSGGGGSSRKKTVTRTVKTPRPAPVKTPVVRDTPRRMRTKEETRCDLTGDCE